MPTLIKYTTEWRGCTGSKTKVRWAALRFSRIYCTFTGGHASEGQMRRLRLHVGALGAARWAPARRGATDEALCARLGSWGGRVSSESAVAPAVM